MPARNRAFLYADSQSGVFHAVSRAMDQRYVFDDAGREFFVKTMRAYEDVLGVEVLTYCVMSNHVHILLRVPRRPEGFDVSLEVLVGRLERALGEEAFALVRRDLEFWETTGNAEAIENWRLKQVARMFSLSEFMRCVKQRFTWWYNRKEGRRGTVWESRFTSVIVEEEERALRTMAAYIDLNPVRAGMVSDPADYRWSGYSEAMSGKARARRGLVRIIGQMAWPREGAPEAQPWGNEVFAPNIERRALVFYRAILGGQGAQRKRADGTVLRRGVSEKSRLRLTTEKERQLTADILSHRVRHFSKGVLIGSRKFIDTWFESNRNICRGRSRAERKRGSRSLGRPALRGLYALRDPRVSN